MSRGNAGYIRPGYDPLEVPNAPTVGAATAGNASVSVTFTAPGDVGGAAITSYGVRTVKTSDSTTISGTGASSPVTVSGLTNGDAYTAAVWALNIYGPSPFSASTSSFTPALARGTWAGGYTSGDVLVNNISYVDLTSTGNASDFGDLLGTYRLAGGCGSTSRGIYSGGATGSDQEVNVIQYITFTTTGNATDFGDMTIIREALACCNSSTRGLNAGGYKGTNPGAGTFNVIDYITIASVGNAIDFGDLVLATRQLGSCSSPTRGIFAGGTGAGNAICYVTIASAGDAIDFGDLSSAARYIASCSSATRGLFGAMDDLLAGKNTIEYITIATTGNTTDFGDLTIQLTGRAACSSSTRGVWGGGVSAYTNVMDYVTIATTGNALDFGDLPLVEGYLAACSSSNGGVQ